jgi:hypothetical protein
MGTWVGAWDVLLALDERDVLGHLGDAVCDAARHDAVRRSVLLGAVRRVLHGLCRLGRRTGRRLLRPGSRRLLRCAVNRG